MGTRVCPACSGLGVVLDDATALYVKALIESLKDNLDVEVMARIESILGEPERQHWRCRASIAIASLSC